MNKNYNKNLGFTLIELLIVIAVMAILTSVVFVALNPLARFQDARNNKRRTDINAMISAIKLHQVDNGGIYHDNISNLNLNQYYVIVEGEDDEEVADVCDLTTLNNDAEEDDCTTIVGTVQACVSLDYLSDTGYMSGIPNDPNYEGDDIKYYYMLKDQWGSITIGACKPEQGSNAATPSIEAEQ